MPLIFKAIARALRDLIQFRILWIMIWPILVASISWLIIGIVFWDTFSEWIFQGFSAIGVSDWLAKTDSGWIANSIQGLIHLLVFVPLIMLTTLVITAFVTMPALIKLVARKHFPNLKYEYGGTAAGNIVNALFAIIVYLIIWIIALPLLTFGVGFFIPFLAAAFLNQQLFKYDALSEHANKLEIKKLVNSNRLPSWNLGLLTGLVQYVPFFNIAAPTFAALAFIHYELAQLDKIRANKIQIEITSRSTTDNTSS
ncbi:MAG: EI24 domain-containing protein [Betaproteobacteria bacterium]|nr:EI24 domain-containing protein [Betaproteobacteria bacterium]